MVTPGECSPCEPQHVPIHHILIYVLPYLEKVMLQSEGSQSSAESTISEPSENHEASQNFGAENPPKFL